MRAILPILLTAAIAANSQSSVRMVAEEVNIAISKNYTAKVRINFRFTGAAGYTPDLAFPESAWFPLQNFRAYWNDSKMAVRKVTADSQAYFNIGKEMYPAVYRLLAASGRENEARHTVEYEYALPFVHDRKFEEAQGHYGEYILTTGAPWAGTIGGIRVNIDLLDCHRLRVVYNGYNGKCITPTRWSFTATNIEPKQNIRFIILP